MLLSAQVDYSFTRQFSPTEIYGIQKRLMLAGSCPYFAFGSYKCVVRMLLFNAQWQVAGESFLKTATQAETVGK